MYYYYKRSAVHFVYKIKTCAPADNHKNKQVPYTVAT